MSGTLRAFDPAIRDGLDGRVRRIADGVGAAYGVRVETRIVRGYPPVVNDVGLAESFSAYMRANSALDVQRTPPTMGGEDFAYFAQRVPGVHVRLGVRSEKPAPPIPATRRFFESTKTRFRPACRRWSRSPPRLEPVQSVDSHPQSVVDDKSRKHYR